MEDQPTELRIGAAIMIRRKAISVEATYKIPLREPMATDVERLHHPFG
jgi:hypothetical protein